MIKEEKHSSKTRNLSASSLSPQQQQQLQQQQRTPSRSPSQLSLSPPTTSPNHAAAQANSSFDIPDALASHTLFAQATPELLKALANVMHVRFYATGDVIISEGDQGRAMFFIVRGACRVQKSDGEVVLAELNPGQFFGEIGLLFDLPRTASVIANARTTVLVLTKPELDKAVSGNTEIKLRLIEEGERRLELSRKKRQDHRRRSSGGHDFDDDTKNTLQRIGSLRDASVRDSGDDISDVTQFDNHHHSSLSLAATSVTTASPSPASYSAPSPTNMLSPTVQRTARRRASSFSERNGSFLNENRLRNKSVDHLGSSSVYTIPSESSSESLPTTFNSSLQSIDPVGWFQKENPAEDDDNVAVVRSGSGTSFEDGDDADEEAVLSMESLRATALNSEPSAMDSMDAEVVSSENWISSTVPSAFQQLKATLTESPSMEKPTFTFSSDDEDISHGPPDYENPFSAAYGGDQKTVDSTPNPQEGRALDSRKFRGIGSLGPRRASVAVWSDPLLQAQLKKASENSEQPREKRRFGALGSPKFSRSFRSDTDDDASDSGESITFSEDDASPGDPFNPDVASDLEVSDVDDTDEPETTRSVPLTIVRPEPTRPQSPNAKPISLTPKRLNSTSTDFSPVIPPSAPSTRHLPSILTRSTSTSTSISSSPTTPNSHLHHQHRQHRERKRNFNIPTSLLTLPAPTLIHILTFLPLKTLFKFRRLSRRTHAFFETHAARLLPTTLDLSPYHKRIDDETLINVLLLWMLPDLTFSSGGDRPPFPVISAAHFTPAPTPTSPTTKSKPTTVSSVPSHRAPGELAGGDRSIESGDEIPTIETSSGFVDEVTPPTSPPPPRHLLHLCLRNCWSVTNRGLATLAPTLPHLRSLDLQGCWDISAPGMVTLRTALDLRRIDLSNCKKIDNDAVVGLVTHCSRLKELKLGYCKALTGEVFAGGRSVWGGVEKLNLQRCTGIWDAGFKYWQGAVEEGFDGEDARRTDRNAEVDGMWQMEDLILSDCSFLTDAAIRNVSSCCPHLRILSLSFCCALTESVSTDLSRGCPNLAGLDLSFCGGAVTDQSLMSLARGLRKLEALGIRGCNRVTEAGLGNLVLRNQEEKAKGNETISTEKKEDVGAGTTGVVAAQETPEPRVNDGGDGSEPPTVDREEEKATFVALRFLNASQCKELTKAFLTQIVDRTQGRLSVCSGNVLEESGLLKNYK